MSAREHQDRSAQRSGATRRAQRSGLALLALAWLCLCSQPVRADERAAATPVAKLSAELASGDEGRTEAALDALGERGGRDAVAVLTEFIRAGQPDALTDRALRALGAARSPEALDVLAAMTRHRRAAARVATFASIARIGGERANLLLAGGLRDSDAGVRGACAHSLGERGARTQIEPLFRAFERGVPEAAVAVARLAKPAELARFHARLGLAPIQNMLAGYEQLLLRTDIDEATKLDVIARLGEVASLSVKRFLERLQADHDWSRQLRVQRSLSDTARRIDDRPKPTGAAP
jgi:HEAT repeat protein